MKQVPQHAGVFQNLIGINNDVLGHFNGQYQLENDICRLNLGLLNVYLVGKPEYIRILMNDERITKPRLGRKLSSLMMGNGLFVSEGAFWKKQRNAIAPIFRPRRVGSMQQQMVGPAQEVCEAWIRAGGSADLIQDLTHLTVQTLVQTIFGVKDSVRFDHLRDHLEALSDQFVKRIQRPIRAPLWVPTRLNRELFYHINAVRGLITDLINIHDSASKSLNTDTLITALRNSVDDNNNPMPEEHVYDEVLNFFLAGHDTTASTLYWAVYEISRHSHVQHTLYQELQQLVDTEISTRHFEQLPYLKAVVAEVLRLYPPGYMLTRQVDGQDYELDGYLLRKNSMVLVPVLAMHRNPNVFNKPEQFDPERWLEGKLENLPKNTYLPFGAGKRFCIGEGFARQEMLTFLATLYRRSETRLTNPDNKPEIFPNATLWPDRSIAISVKEKN